MEAYNLFSNMTVEINKNIVEFLCHATIPSGDGSEQVKEGKQQKTDLSKMRTQHESVESDNDYIDPSTQKQEPVVVGPKIGRNDPCPCGSGKKYKACHGRE
jgi:preprotein translocase subunit SecA